MRTLLICATASILFIGCNNSPLTSNQAADLIQAHYKYPNPITLELDQKDPDRASQLRTTELATMGLIEIVEENSLVHIDSPLFKLTAKGQIYQVSSSQPGVIQVKLANETMKQGSVQVQQENSSNKSTATFITEFSDRTPFMVLSSLNLDKEKKHTANFYKDNNGSWTLVD